MNKLLPLAAVFVIVISAFTFTKSKTTPVCILNASGDDCYIDFKKSGVDFELIYLEWDGTIEDCNLASVSECNTLIFLDKN